MEVWNDVAPGRGLLDVDMNGDILLDAATIWQAAKTKFLALCDDFSEKFVKVC